MLPKKLYQDDTNSIASEIFEILVKNTAIPTIGTLIVSMHHVTVKVVLCSYYCIKSFADICVASDDENGQMLKSTEPSLQFISSQTHEMRSTIPALEQAQPQQWSTQLLLPAELQQGDTNHIASNEFDRRRTYILPVK